MNEIYDLCRLDRVSVFRCRNGYKIHTCGMRSSPESRESLSLPAPPAHLHNFFRCWKLRRKVRARWQGTAYVLDGFSLEYDCQEPHDRQIFDSLSPALHIFGKVNIDATVSRWKRPARTPIYQRRNVTKPRGTETKSQSQSWIRSRGSCCVIDLNL